MEKQNIQPFLTVANFHLIEQQIDKILNAYATTKDKGVILAVKGLVETELTTQLPNLQAQTDFIEQLLTISDRAQADKYLENIQAYVIPFKKVTESNLSNLFKKEKRLKLPKLHHIDFYRTVYLTWDDLGNHRKYIVLEQEGKLKGFKGTFDTNILKGVCNICRHHSDVSLFTTSVKGKTPGTFTKYSNYICTDSQRCNQNITSSQSVLNFLNHISE